MSILIALDGVIRSDTNTPIREGRILYEAFAAENRVVLMCDEEKEKVEHWLVQYGVKGYAGLLTPSVLLADDDPIRPRQIATARALGRVDMVVDCDPDVVVHCYDIDVPALLFAHPKTTIPVFRPDAPRDSWATIQERLERQREREAGL